MSQQQQERVANPEKGVSFGLELPYMFRQETRYRGWTSETCWVVYFRKTGRIVASYDGSETVRGVTLGLSVEQKAFWAQELAFRECIRRNKCGGPPPIGEIDLTP